MAETMPQTYANHARFDPPYHFFIIPVAAVTVLLTGYAMLTTGFYFATLWSLIATIAALLAGLKMRTYSLKVQDRLIGLEERLRLASLLPENLKARIGELSPSQLVALRFASDAEIPALTEKVLNEKLTNPQIKQAIVTWRPDYFRV